MPVWWWLLDSLLLAVAVVIVGLGLIVLRRRSIERRPGAFELTVNRKPEGAAGWTMGTAVYRDDHLEWFRTFSLSWRPALVLPRRGVEVTGRRSPQSSEVGLVGLDSVVVDWDGPDGDYRMALTPPVLNGLLAWLESSPPGRGVGRVV
ncbi:MAG: DUF2550 domain-containing protein [Aeromicrobium sp.]|uniref:DUF2550 domain-containing protein n=1 Tax=Aeromicrobium sp. TaxID=1871063 RepID=UPI0039E646AE